MKFFLLFTFLVLYLHAQKESALSQAFTNANILGNITLFSYNIDTKNTENSYATALGGFLKCTTDQKNPFFASIAFYQSSSVGPNQNKARTALFNNDQNASNLTVLGESFLSYKTKENLFKVGNMRLYTPMMNDDTTRIVPWSYQGAAFTSELFSQTKVQLYHISQIRNHTSGNYKKESASGKFDKGINMFGLTNESFTGFSLQGYYYHAPDLYSTAIAQIDYNHVESEDFLFCLGLQYFKSGKGGKYNDRENLNGGDNIKLLALKAGIDGPQYSITLNYSQNFGISGIVKGYGGLSKVYTTSMVANGRGNYKPETWMLKSRFDVDPFNYGQSEFAIWLTNTRVHDNRGNNFDAFYSHIRHYFNAGTSLYLRFEAIDYHNSPTNDVNYLRLIASYDF